jgi:hypothetical protein
VNALSRTIVESKPADDTMLALIESFLDQNASEIPRFISVALNPNEDQYDQGLLPEPYKRTDDAPPCSS